MRANHSRSILPMGKLNPEATQISPELEMTSLVDMMVILVVFLLMSFSADEQIVAPSEGLQLPKSTSQVSVSPGVMVEVGLEQIIIDGRSIVPLSALSTGESNEMALLRKALSVVGESEKTQSLLIQADRRVEFSHLSVILQECSNAGLNNLSLVVLGGEQ